MIPHPSPDRLLAKHGNTAAGRKATRAEVTRHILATARQEAAVAGLSLNSRDRFVAFGVEHEPCGGTTGIRCLCVCHDPKDATATAREHTKENPGC